MEEELSIKASRRRVGYCKLGLCELRRVSSPHVMGSPFIRFLGRHRVHNPIACGYGGCAGYREANIRVDGLVSGESHKSHEDSGQGAVSMIPIRQ